MLESLFGLNAKIATLRATLSDAWAAKLDALRSAITDQRAANLDGLTAQRTANLDLLPGISKGLWRPMKARIGYGGGGPMLNGFPAGGEVFTLPIIGVYKPLLSISGVGLLRYANVYAYDYNNSPTITWRVVVDGVVLFTGSRVFPVGKSSCVAFIGLAQADQSGQIAVLALDNIPFSTSLVVEVMTNQSVANLACSFVADVY